MEVEDLPRARGDETALYRVFANLVQNAVKYARPGEPARVRVSARLDGKRCEVLVRDWGRGITPAERERVFNPLRRGDDLASLPGAGLGLTAVCSLVMEQGGLVWVDHDTTDGACIRLSLPAA